MRALLAAALLALPAPAAALDLRELMAALAQVPEAKDSFVETRHSAVLTAPLVLKGELAYVRPDRMEKQVLAPYFERTVISGGSVTIENRSTKRTFSLASSAPVSALIESLRATLAGDRAALERHYEVQLEGREASWTLTLAPRDAKLAALVKRIQIAGARVQLKRIEIEETAGDRSVMLIGPERP
jgi:outer membrane lipoprotein-sorting protein